MRHSCSVSSDGLDFGHVRGSVGEFAGFDGLASNVADAEHENALGWHEPEMIRADVAAEEFGVVVQGKTFGSLESGPQTVIGTGGGRIGGTQDDMPAERVVPGHEVEGGVEAFGGDFPGDEGTRGEVGGKEGLADTADGAGPEHGADALEDGGQIDAAARGDFAERIRG